MTCSANELNTMLSMLLATPSESFWLPQRASTVAADVDWLFYFISGICIIFTALILVLLTVFIIRYRYRGPDDKPMARSPSNSTALEISWTVLPTLIVLTIFYTGFEGYLHMSVVPPNTYEIKANGKMWKWSFTYPNGYSDAELHVPKGIPVRLVLTSEDVIHDLYIPAFRVKKDATPGRFNRLWFQTTATGTFDAYCAEYCGTNHSNMTTKVIVQERSDFDAWLEKASDWARVMTPVEAGQMFFSTRGCNQCHTVDGSRLIGPTLKDLYGSMQPLRDGAQVLADENYLHESIVQPGAKVVAGYDNVMPSYQGTLKDRDINAIILWMKSQSVYGALAPPGTAPVTAPATAPSSAPNNPPPGAVETKENPQK